MAREINLVPDVKDEMISTLKLRNLIFFICIVVAAASIGITVLVGLIAGGQRLAISGKQDSISSLSDKITNYKDLEEYLTIKDQLTNINGLTDNKMVLSRTFNILSALLPTEGDTIRISEMTVNLSEGAPTFSFYAQADAVKEPFIDYNVLDSFKKSMQYMHYDYGQYVDKYDATIPAYCMIETGADGAMLKNENDDIYAYWLIDGKGCDPSAKTDESGKTESTASQYTIEEYNGQRVVRIWRKPQYKAWYKTTKTENEPYMDLHGNISGVPHFNSMCISYEGNDEQDANNPKWEETNTCNLIPGGIEGIRILDSANGRDSSEKLVLRFSAVITLAPEVYKYENTHMRAIPPAGRHNVTDSYAQIQSMFSEKPKPCEEGDVDCGSNTMNEGKDQGQSSNANGQTDATDNTSTNGGNQ